MNIKVLRRLEQIATEENVRDDIKDEKALSYINELAIIPSQNYLKSKYERFYYECKKHHRNRKGEVI